MSATAQCQKPDPVGASGSYIVTAKLLVPAGAPDQASCGDRSWPPTSVPNSAADNGCPSVMSSLVTGKDGTGSSRA